MILWEIGEEKEGKKRIIGGYEGKIGKEGGNVDKVNWIRYFDNNFFLVIFYIWFLIF